MENRWERGGAATIFMLKHWKIQGQSNKTLPQYSLGHPHPPMANAQKKTVFVQDLPGFKQLTADQHWQL